MSFFFLFGAIALFYLVRRINWRLIEIEEELIYRTSREEVVDIIKKDNCEHEKESEEGRFENNLLLGNKAKKPEGSEGSYYRRNQMD
jgi:hypothetical protein